MCYDDKGPTANYQIVCSAKKFDCNKDDYFNPRPPTGNYLYTHWDLGFCANAYILRNGCITAPRNLAATTGIPTGIRLTWDGPSSNGGAPIDRYKVFRATCASCTKNFYSYASGTSYFDDSTAPQQTYYYNVRVLNVWADTSEPSNDASAPALG
jgi:hypothetical protein